MTAKRAIYCRASMNYTRRDADDTCSIEVDVLDGRVAQLPAWTECGFQLLSHRTAVADWNDDVAISAVHYAELEQLARTLTGCDHALVAGHIKRNPAQAALHADYAPIAYVHSDFAASYGAALREMYSNDGEGSSAALVRAGITADVVRRAARTVVLQFWRNIGPELMDQPLAFCDARTVPASDVRAVPVLNYANSGFNFDTLAMLPPALPGSHDWYVFAAMTVQEVVAFRTYDSARVATGEAFWTPHSAFHDPRVPLGRPSRSSIELRATCLFL